MGGSVQDLWNSRDPVAPIACRSVPRESKIQYSQIFIKSRSTRYGLLRTPNPKPYGRARQESQGPSGNQASWSIEHVYMFIFIYRISTDM